MYSVREWYSCFPTSIQDSSQCHKHHEVKGHYATAGLYVESTVPGIICTLRSHILKVSKEGVDTKEAGVHYGCVLSTQTIQTIFLGLWDIPQEFPMLLSPQHLNSKVSVWPKTEGEGSVHSKWYSRPGHSCKSRQCDVSHCTVFPAPSTVPGT